MAWPARAGLVRLCDRDLADFGFTVAKAPNLLGTQAITYPTGALAGLAGQVSLASEATLDPTVIPIEVAFLGESRSELATALDALTHWCTLGPLELSSSFDWGKLALVQFGGASLFVPGKQFARPVLQGTLTFVRQQPYTFDRYARRATTNGSGPANRVACETGTAPSHAVLWLLNATVATITQRAADGTIVRQSTVTTVQGANDALLLESARAQVVKYVGGVRSDAPRDLTLGHGFVTLEPRYAHYEAQRWQTVETSSGRLLIDWVRGWIR